MLASIEAGGTKFVCAVSDLDLNIIDKLSFPTGDPKETIEKVVEFFDQYKNIQAMGIGSFGPIDIDRDSSSYGYITSTPKLEWKNFNFLGEIKKYYNIAIGWTTDVNAACLGEYRLGAARDKSSAIYLTIGTGIGGGAIVDGKFLEGFSHPEMGHIMVRRHWGDSFRGSCPYHGDCLEGLASGPSIEKRYRRAESLEEDNEIWDIVSYYIAQALVNYTYIVRPEIIILGGGLMKQAQVLDLIKKHFSSLLANYVEIPNIDEYIVLASLGDNSGIIGGLLLAKDSL